MVGAHLGSLNMRILLLLSGVAAATDIVEVAFYGEVRKT